MCGEGQPGGQDSQLEVGHGVGGHDEAEVEQAADGQVQAQPAGVVVGVQPVAQVRPAGVQRRDALQLGPEKPHSHPGTRGDWATVTLTQPPPYTWRLGHRDPHTATLVHVETGPP